MEKTYRRLRSSARKKTAVPVHASGFLVRMGICALAFMAFAAVKLHGGETLLWAQNQIDYYLFGAPAFSEAYTQSIEAFNQFCDRWVEAQND